MLKKCFILIMSVVLSVTLLFANGCTFIEQNSKNSEIETPGDETPGDETPGGEKPGDDLEQIIPGDHNYGIGELPLN